MSSKKHVLFVCTGNTCRSPMAEGLFHKAIAGRDDFSVGSAGVAASNGTPASRETALILKSRSAGLENFASRQVSKKLLEEATHVFAMTESHLGTLEALFPQYTDKYHLTCEFVNIKGRGIGVDVPDPIGMGQRAYDETAEIIEAAIPTIIAYIDQTSKD